MADLDCLKVELKYHGETGWFANRLAFTELRDAIVFAQSLQRASASEIRDWRVVTDRGELMAWRCPS